MATPTPSDVDLSARVHKSQLEHKLLLGADRGWWPRCCWRFS